MSKLYEFQKQGVSELLKHNGRNLLADEMGLGKTIQALFYLKKMPDDGLTIVICPASIKWVWRSEALKHVRMKSKILHGKFKDDSKFNPSSKRRIIIINYDILNSWLPFLKKLKPNTIIIDECHYQKNRKAQRTKAVRKLARKVPHIIAISGTPLTNRPAELYTTLNLLWPEHFNSFWTYAFRYCKPYKSNWGWVFSGSRNRKELHQKLKSLGMIRRLKKDVLTELPEKIKEIVPLSIQNRSEYKKATNNFIAWLSEKSKRKAERAKRAKKLVQIGYLKRLAAKLKMKSVLEWVDNFLESNDGKIVLFCSHKSILKELHRRYKNISVAVDGSVKNDKRKRAVNRFQKNKKIRIFIGNIIAAGTGITLTAASTVAFVELDWSPGNHEQAEDRIHRIGQKCVSNIYYLVAKNTIEEHLYKIIQAKQKVLSAILDGGSEKNVLSTYKLLKKQILSQKKHGKKEK